MLTPEKLEKISKKFFKLPIVGAILGGILMVPSCGNASAAAQNVFAAGAIIISLGLLIGLPLGYATKMMAKNARTSLVAGGTETKKKVKTVGVTLLIALGVLVALMAVLWITVSFLQWLVSKMAI